MREKRTEIADQETFDTKVLVLFGVLERDGDCATHVITCVVDGQLDFLAFSHAYLVIGLIVFRVEGDVNLYPSC